MIVRSATKSIAGVVTVGYDSPAIRELEYQAKAVSITLLNEVGVNPGAYHLYAIKARVKGMMQPRLFCRFWPVYLVKFHSYRGEIHAIEVSDSPLRFGVRWPIPCTDVPPCVTSNFPVSSAATRRLALATELCYLFQDGKVIEISDKDLISRAVRYHVLDGYSFPAYPNRDYVLFQQAYVILETHTVI